MLRTGILTATVLLLSACSGGDENHRVVGELTSDRVELSVEFAEPIVDIAVMEGATVSAGEVLLRQNDSRARVQLADAEAVYLQSKARMDELLRGPRSEQIAAARANVEGATQELDFRQTELERIEEVHQRGLASAEVLDRASAALDAAQATLKLRLAQLEELLAGTTLEELAQAEQTVKQTAARRDRARIDLERHVLTAPVDGVVDSRIFEVGERPTAGQAAIILLAGEQVHARVYVPEAIRVHIGSGTKAAIYVDGLETPIAGAVRSVATEAAFTPYYALTEHDRGRLSYVAKVDIAEALERLPDGVPVEVEFVLD